MHRFAFLAGMAGLLFIAVCSSGGGSAVAAGAGYVVGDEPYAVKTGAAALDQGGSAADAAAAMYFTLAVTYPMAAGLGGGGICVVHDPASGANEAFEFLPHDAAGGGSYAVAGSVNGIAAMQTAYGKLPWQRAVGTAEGIAATGFPISRALAIRLRASQDVIRLDAGLAAEFLDESGQVKREGSVVMNGDLAQTLSAIRSYGANGFYGGPVAQKISAYAVAQAGSVSLAELRAYRTAGSQPGAINVGGNTVYGPSAHVGARAFANELLSRLLDQSGNPLPQDNLAAATAAATKAALDKFAIASLPEDLGATGFAALDDSGQAVACAVTMNGPFGSGHTAAGTGVTLAKAPSSGKAGLSSAFLTPVIATEGASGAVTLAGAGVGGPNGSAAIVYALLRLGSGADLTQPSMVRTTGIAPYDTVNVIACKDAACVALADPGANGLGLSTGR